MKTYFYLQPSLFFFLAVLFSSLWENFTTSHVANQPSYQIQECTTLGLSPEDDQNCKRNYCKVTWFLLVFTTNSNPVNMLSEAMAL